MAISATATNMNSVEADGSQDGDNTLNASGMILGVDLEAYGYGNTLQGGAGPDTLDGGNDGDFLLFDTSFGYDSLVAGNGNDLLYFSGSYSSYVGTGSNKLIYVAQPNDSIVVYQDGLLVNGSLVYATYQWTTVLLFVRQLLSVRPSCWCPASSASARSRSRTAVRALPQHASHSIDLPRFETYSETYTSNLWTLAHHTRAMGNFTLTLLVRPLYTPMGMRRQAMPQISLSVLWRLPLRVGVGATWAATVNGPIIPMVFISPHP